MNPKTDVRGLFIHSGGGRGHVIVQTSVDLSAEAKYYLRESFEHPEFLDNPELRLRITGFQNWHAGMAVMRAGLMEEGDTLQAIGTVSAGAAHAVGRARATGVATFEGDAPEVRVTYSSKPHEEVRPVRIARPPGAAILRLADFLYSPKTFERVFQTLVADMRNEYCAALSSGRTDKARWIVLRYRAAFLYNALVCPLLAAFEKIRSISK